MCPSESGFKDHGAIIVRIEESNKTDDESTMFVQCSVPEDLILQR